MKFSDTETQRMVALKGVGYTVVERLEQIGFSSLSQLVHANAADITLQISQMIGSTCWHNSPQAKNAVNAIIELAQSIDPKEVTK